MNARSMQRSTTGTLSSQGARLTRGHATRSVSVPTAYLQINTTEMALRVITFHLYPSLLSYNPFLNTLPSEFRGLVDELSPGDSSSRWTIPNAVVCLPPWC
ncbi:hypothetical protein AVEN_201776-1 [Araneus ventricosus]|uniref:Uncharacterized protein n=1 Tax=Araneus ventricosus TaxID=182803 RepID=A0A4Y2MPP1_ARAVE|nr:hypothetical protein AVEN_201776-1 [Araneus ventricosus]